MSKRALHEQFKYRVCIVIRDSHEYIKFHCKNAYNVSAYPLTSYSYGGIGRSMIFRLFSSRIIWHELPSKYYYSSGLNNPSGYK